jgi:hypothetical protein
VGCWTWKKNWIRTLAWLPSIILLKMEDFVVSNLSPQLLAYSYPSHSHYFIHFKSRRGMLPIGGVASYVEQYQAPG